MTKISTYYAAYSIVQQSNDQDIYIVRYLQYCAAKYRPRYLHSTLPTILCIKVMTKIYTEYAAYSIVQQSNDQYIFIVRCLQYCAAK